MFESIISSYGYYAVFAFACIEGEVAVVTAGFLCKSGLLSLDLVMLYAFLGTVLAEQGLFFVGRRYGPAVLQKYPKVEQKSHIIMSFLQKYGMYFIFASRFVYGIRNVSPLIVGMSGISPMRFSVVNIPAAVIWSVSVAGAGYLCADFVERTADGLKYLQIAALVALVVFVVFYIKRNINKKK